MSEPSRYIHQQEDVYFSQRLSGWGGHFLFLLTVVITITSLLGSFRGIQINLLLLLLLMSGYAVLGTAGWHWAISQRVPHIIYRYFLLQFVYILLLMAYELTVGVIGLSTTILGVGLMMQSSILPLRPRISLIVGLLLLVAAFYTQSMRVSITNITQIASFIALFSMIFLIGLFVGLLIVREEQARETSIRLDESNRKLAQYASEVETLSTMQERNRLAREIHDNLGHYLTTINMQLEVALMALAKDDEPARTAVTKAQTLTKEALAEIRRSISALRATPIENRTLNEAIALLVDEHRAAGNTISYQITGTIRPCLPLIEMTVYRIAQEALTNVRKHAANNSAHVTLSYDTKTVSLEVQDDGQGSDDFDHGFGLLGIRERVQSLGGTLTIETKKGYGFKLRVIIEG